jgi:hypothetical protein
MQVASKSMYQCAAEKRFPISASVGNIRGDGKYALISKCGKRWRVLLFKSEEDRAFTLSQWHATHCPAGSSGCFEDHSTEDLQIR